jgi:hypothetical protein
MTLRFVGVVLVLAAQAGMLTAQRGPSRGAPRATSESTARVSGGIGLDIVQPRGEFAETVNAGAGFSLNALFRGDNLGLLHLRTEFGFLSHGNVRQRVPLSPTLGNFIQVDLRTSNNIVSMLAGPQLLGPTGTFSPYAAALGGFSVFWTESTLEGSNNTQPFASTTNSSDVALAYGGAVGAYWRVTRGPSPVRLNIGARFLRHDDVTYLSASAVRDAVQRREDPRPRRSRADFTSYHLGVQIPLR